jgi:signal transduction histidine kinase
MVRTVAGFMGLQIMNERIGDVGGSLEIKSEPGRGCWVTAIWFDCNVQLTRQI